MIAGEFIFRGEPVDTSGAQVEALRLDSIHGVAVSLLNWSPTEESCLRVRVRGGARYTSLTYSEGALTDLTRVGDDLEVRLTLDRVGVLKLEP